MSKAMTDPTVVRIPVGKCPRCGDSIFAVAIVIVTLDVAGTNPNAENKHLGVFVSSPTPKLIDVKVEHACSDSNAVAERGDD